MRLVAKRDDLCGYVNYVFANLEPADPNLKYVMCTQFPNWSQSPIEVGDVGFVTVRYVTAGEDMWFNGIEYVPYKCTDVHFLKFIPEPKDSEDVTLVL